VETVWLRTLYVLFCIELGTRRVRLAGVTTNPDCVWVSQQARNLAIEERLANVRYLIHDRDAKPSASRSRSGRSHPRRSVCATRVRTAGRAASRIRAGLAEGVGIDGVLERRGEQDLFERRLRLRQELRHIAPVAFISDSSSRR
jgi:hypothetical protein